MTELLVIFDRSIRERDFPDTNIDFSKSPFLGFRDKWIIHKILLLILSGCLNNGVKVLNLSLAKISYPKNLNCYFLFSLALLEMHLLSIE